MTVEVATFISELDALLPADTDGSTELDDHLRLIKAVLQNTFVGDGAGDDYDQPVTATLTEMNSWDARLTTMEGSPTTVPSPVFGHENVDFTQVGNLEVTGIGFQPRQILAWAMGEFLTLGDLGQFSFASWSDVGPNEPNSHGWNTSGGNTFTFLATTFLYRLIDGQARGSIDSVGPDGFTLSFDSTNVEADILYIAFP